MALIFPTRSVLSSWTKRALDILHVLICLLGFVRAEDEVEENTVENDLGASREASRTGGYLTA